MRNLYILFALSVSFFMFSPAIPFDNLNKEFEGKAGKTAINVKENKRLMACTPVTSFSEDFNLLTTPNLPTCWEKVGDNGTIATQGAGANSAPNALYLASTVGNNKNDLAVVTLPSVSNLGAGTHRLRFSMRAVSNLGSAIEVGTIANSSNTSTFNVLQTVTATSTTYQTFIVTPPAGTGREMLAFRHTGSPTYGVLIDDVVWEPIPLCITPASISVSSINSTGATISWPTPSSSPINYDVFLNTTGVAPADGATPFATAVNSPFNATSLNGSTTYYVWIRSNCGANGKSVWSASQSFTTACSGFSLPYTLNFDAVTTPELPNCVTLQNVNNDNRTWQTAPAPIGYSGNVMTYFFSQNSVADDWFFTQGLNLAAGKSYIVSYKFGNNSTAFTERMKVGFGLNPAAASMTTIADYPSVNDNFPRVHKIKFTAPTTGVYYVGFQAYSPMNQFQLFVDDISVTEANVAPTAVNTCVNVTVPRIDEQSNTKWMALVDAAGNIVGEINANGNNLGDVTARVFRNSGPLRKDFYNRYYLDRNIEITPATQPITPVSVRLYFSAAEYAALQAEPNSNVSSYTGVSVFKSSEACGSRLSSGASKLTTATTQYGSDFVASFNVNSFSSFYFAASAFSALPATIVSFSGARQGAANLLKWTVAQEADILEYEVERSENNGANWSKVGSVVAFGNSASQRSYGFTDNAFTGLKQLYRLRQVDRTGLVKLSSIVSISSGKPTKLALSSLFPNPATSRVNMLIDAPQKDNLTIEVIDATGRVVKVQRNAVEIGSNTLQLNIASLNKGTYLIRLTCTANCETTVTRFVKD